MGHAKAPRAEGVPIGAYRCQECGFLELYPDPSSLRSEVALWPERARVGVCIGIRGLARANRALKQSVVERGRQITRPLSSPFTLLSGSANRAWLSPPAPSQPLACWGLLARVLDGFTHGIEVAAHDAETADFGGVLRGDGNGDGDGFLVDVQADVMHDFVRGCLVSISVINDPVSGRVAKPCG